MKPLLAILCLLCSSALVPAAIVAANDADPAQTPASAPQQSIPSQIRTEMADQHVASMTDISVDADAAGVVSLSGSANSQDDIDKVVSIAHNTAGVRAVNNNVTVKKEFQ